MSNDSIFISYSNCTFSCDRGKKQGNFVFNSSWRRSPSSVHLHPVGFLQHGCLHQDSERFSMDCHWSILPHMSTNPVPHNPVSFIFDVCSFCVKLKFCFKSIGKQDENAKDFTPIKSLVYTWFAILSKGWPKTPKKISSRIVFIRYTFNPLR